MGPSDFSQFARPSVACLCPLALPPSLLSAHPVMIIQLVARNTSEPFTSAQLNNSDSSPTTAGDAHTPFLIRRNLIGVLVIAALLVLGIALWLCFGKWSKPIRHFFKGKSRSSRRKVLLPGPERADSDAEKAEIVVVDSGSCSTQNSLLGHQDALKINGGDKVELALPAKVYAPPLPVLQIKSGSRLAGLVR